MTRTFALLACLALPACAHPQQAPAPAEDADEAAIYAVVIDSVIAGPQASFVVVAQRTSTSHESADQLRPFVQSIDSTFPPSAIDDFARRNATESPLPATIASHAAVRLFDPDAQFRPGGDLRQEYADFQQRYAPATSFHTLSRPGIDAERRRAIIVVGSYCGALCGHGQVLLLERGPAGWRVTERRGTWVS